MSTMFSVTLVMINSLNMVVTKLMLNMKNMYIRVTTDVSPCVSKANNFVINMDRCRNIVALYSNKNHHFLAHL